jgi:hypothetical protein
MTERLFKAGPQEVVSGLHPGVQNQSIPLWETGRNVLFEDAAIKPGPGQSPLFENLGNLPGIGVLATTGLLTTQNENDPGLIWGDREGLYRGVQIPNTVDVTRVSGVYTGTDEDQWSMVQFGRLTLATNGVDPVQYLAVDGSNFVDIDTVSDLDSTFRCRLLAKLGPYIIALNTDNDAREYRWCHEDSPLIWTPLATNHARDIQMRELNSSIVGIVPLAAGLAVIGRNSIRLIRYIGPPFFFGDTHLIGNVGAMSKYAVVESGRILYGFGPDGIWASDGTSFEYIDQPSMHKYVYDDTLDVDRAAMVATWADADNSMIYFSYPTIDGDGQTVGWDYKHRLWSLHAYWRMAATNGETWQIPITLDIGGNVWGQGVRGQPTVSDPTPLAITNGVAYSWGYGHLGYGQDAYGGSVSYPAAI